jgi:hypothetical protein
MPDQFAGQAIDVDPFKIVEFFAQRSKISGPCTTATWTPWLLKILPLTTDSYRGSRVKLRFLGGNSQINRAKLVPSLTSTTTAFL